MPLVVYTNQEVAVAATMVGFTLLGFAMAIRLFFFAAPASPTPYRGPAVPLSRRFKLWSLVLLKLLIGPFLLVRYCWRFLCRVAESTGRDLERSSREPDPNAIPPPNFRDVDPLPGGSSNKQD